MKFFMKLLTPSLVKISTKAKYCKNIIFSFLISLQVLKETLVRHGFTFESETDTEVIPKLAKFVFDRAHDGEGNYRIKCFYAFYAW